MKEDDIAAKMVRDKAIDDVKEKTPFPILTALASAFEEPTDMQKGA
jgi:hypothetical protein